MLALLAASPARAQVLPNPDLLVPFAPITYNGPVAGNGGGPGQFRANFVHIQATPGAGAGPGFEATYVNNPGPPADGLIPLPMGEVVSTEILAWPVPLIGQF